MNKEIEQRIHNFNNAAYQFGKDAKAQFQKAYDNGYAAVNNINLIDEAYQEGLTDAWECIKKIIYPTEDGGLSVDELVEIFGTAFPYHILRDNLPSIATQKIEDWEKKQKQQEEEIYVGDKVYSEEDDLRFVVTRIMDGRYEGICTDGACYCPLPLDIKKTGRHAYRIIELLGELDEMLQEVQDADSN